jgi:hypothetical protein
MATSLAFKLILMSIVTAGLTSCAKIGESGEISVPMSLLAMIAVPVLVALAYGFLMSTMATIRTAARIPEQRKREDLAHDILSRLRSGQDPGKYWIYLRSFRSDKFEPDWHRALYGFSTTPDIAIEPTLDETLCNSLESTFGHSICVGK